MERAEAYARVTGAVVAAIEDGTAKGRDRRMPWRRRGDAGASPALPVNVARGAAYRGVNALALWTVAEARGHPAGLWGTYRQWAELGGQVRRGERATKVVFWCFSDAAGWGEAPSPAEDGEEGEDGARRVGSRARLRRVQRRPGG